MNAEPVILEGRRARMEPLKKEHADELAKFAFNEQLWLWTTNLMRDIQDLDRYVDRALDEQRSRVALPFVTVERATGRVVGSSRFGNIDVANRKVEIGWTWIDPAWQRTYVNTEAKLLMLTHAFETWKCIRVELKTDALNTKSRAAMQRIGATEEGTLRSHMITESGRIRDSVYFSIVEKEWAAVKRGLLEKLNMHKQLNTRDLDT
jgi:RimJ/RimL family protein N-acetyltransferase